MVRQTKRRAVDVEIVPARRSQAVAKRKPRGPDADEIAALVATWLRLKKGQTLAAYQLDLQDFATFLRAPEPSMAIATLLCFGPLEASKTVAEYVDSMRKRPVWRSTAARDAGRKPYRHGLAPATINRRLSALMSICKLARAFALVDWELQVEWQRAMKYRDTTGVEPDSLRQILAYLRARIDESETDVAMFRARRDYAMARVLYDHALRKSEMLELEVQDIQLGKRPRMWVLGKGAREHETQKVEMALSDTSASALEAYLQLRGSDPGPLFLSTWNRVRRGLNVRSFNAMLTRWCEEADTAQARPHAFRHGALTKLAERTNGNVFKMQQVSRHVSIQTLTKYVHNAKDQQRELVNLIADGAEDESP